MMPGLYLKGFLSHSPIFSFYCTISRSLCFTPLIMLYLAFSRLLRFMLLYCAFSRLLRFTFCFPTYRALRRFPPLTVLYFPYCVLPRFTLLSFAFSRFLVLLDYLSLIVLYPGLISFEIR